MNYADKFNKNIMNMISRFAYPMYFIRRDTSIKCTCITHETDQADVDCSKCLGTGFKIIIKKIKAAAQDTKMPPALRGNKFVIARSFFINNDIIIQKSDVVVDRNIPYLVLEMQELISFEGIIPYTKVLAIEKKFDSKAFVKNFNAIINAKK